MGLTMPNSRVRINFILVSRRVEAWMRNDLNLRAVSNLSKNDEIVSVNSKLHYRFGVNIDRRSCLIPPYSIPTPQV